MCDRLDYCVHGAMYMCNERCETHTHINTIYLASIALFCIEAPTSNDDDGCLV